MSSMTMRVLKTVAIAACLCGYQAAWAADECVRGSNAPVGAVRTPPQRPGADTVEVTAEGDTAADPQAVPEPPAKAPEVPAKRRH